MKRETNTYGPTMAREWTNDANIFTKEGDWGIDGNGSDEGWRMKVELVIDKTVYGMNEKLFGC